MTCKFVPPLAGSILMLNVTITANPVVEHARNIRGGIKLLLILGNVAVF